MENRSDICNVLPSPHDPRDWYYEGRVASSIERLTLPKTFKCKNLTPVKNQGTRGTCVAMSLSCIKEYQESIDNPELKGELMSPDSVYFYRKPKSGMYPRNAMKILKERGMCTDNLLPYQDSDIKKLGKDVKKEALQFRIKSYAQVSTIEGAKKYLLEYGPLMIVFPYYDNGSPYFWKKPTIKADIDGGHAVTIIGWDKKGFILRNSWGERWNGDGHVLYRYDEWGSHWEIWGCIDIEKDYIPEHIKNRESKKVLKILKMFCIT